MNDRFLKTSAELDLDVDSMPGNEKAKKDFALWLCRENGPIPDDCLQVGMMILRALNLDKLADDENPPFWAFVGLLEWVNVCSPAEEALGQIIRDLRSFYPMSRATHKRVMEKIAQKRPELHLASMRVMVHP